MSRSTAIFERAGVSESGTASRYQTSWLNLAGPVGLPSIVLPAGSTNTGLPLALQIIGPYLSDRTLIAAAQQLARILPTPASPPSFTT